MCKQTKELTEKAQKWDVYEFTVFTYIYAELIKH